jgi:anti-anti-sigma regulatory factor
MSCHRIDLAVHDGIVSIITIAIGRFLDPAEALLLREDVLDRLDRLSGRPAAIIIDLRGLFEADAQALEIINSLEERARRYVHLVDITHVLRWTEALEIVQAEVIASGERPTPVFTTCAEAIGFLTGVDETFESSVA